MINPHLTRWIFPDPVPSFQTLSINFSISPGQPDKNRGDIFRGGQNHGIFFGIGCSPHPGAGSTRIYSIYPYVFSPQLMGPHLSHPFHPERR